MGLNYAKRILVGVGDRDMKYLDRARQERGWSYQKFFTFALQHFIDFLQANRERDLKILAMQRQEQMEATRNEMQNKANAQRNQQVH